MIKSTALDFSLLEEYVEKVIIYDAEGNKKRQYEQVGEVNALQIEREGLERGSYTVEVRTASSSFNLKLEVGNPDKMGYFQVKPNPITNGKAQIDLRQFEDDIASIQLLSMDGRTLKSYSPFSFNTSNFVFLQEELKAGMYLLEVITENQERHIAKILIQ